MGRHEFVIRPATVFAELQQRSCCKACVCANKIIFANDVVHAITQDYPAPTGYQEAMQRQLWMPPDLQQLEGTANMQLAGYYGMVKRLDECLVSMVWAGPPRI